MNYFATCLSPLGRLTLASDGENLTGLWMEGQKYFGATLAEDAARQEDLPVFCDTRRWLLRYFAGEKPAASELPLCPGGGEFRREVWRLLCQIPYGEVVTYGGIGKKVAAGLNREAVCGRAVGGAVGHNPISIIIPCHRVVGAGGRLTGYAGGIERKVALLKLEGVDLSSLSAPGKKTLP